jgi:hypothetical protein
MFLKEVQIVSLEGIATDSERLKFVQEWRRPKHKRELIRSLGLCTYYQRFIGGFKEIERPLSQIRNEMRNCQRSPEGKATCLSLKTSFFMDLF